jgi:hypothetical protein
MPARSVIFQSKQSAVGIRLSVNLQKYGEMQLQSLIGALIIIGKRAKEPEDEVQKDGSECELAEERWITAYPIACETVRAPLRIASYDRQCGA